MIRWVVCCRVVVVDVLCLDPAPTWRRCSDLPTLAAFVGFRDCSRVLFPATGTKSEVAISRLVS